jgi:hypothetical protein
MKYSLLVLTKPQISIHGIRPLALIKRQTVLVLGSPKLVQRMLRSVQQSARTMDGGKGVGTCARSLEAFRLVLSPAPQARSLCFFRRPHSE